MDRVEQVRRHVDVAHQRGLEIGPLVNPLVTRGMGMIKYADHASTEELRAWYADSPTASTSRRSPPSTSSGET